MGENDDDVEDDEATDFRLGIWEEQEKRKKREEGTVVGEN